MVLTFLFFEKPPTHDRKQHASLSRPTQHKYSTDRNALRGFFLFFSVSFSHIRYQYTVLSFFFLLPGGRGGVIHISPDITAVIVAHPTISLASARTRAHSERSLREVTARLELLPERRCRCVVRNPRRWRGRRREGCSCRGEIDALDRPLLWFCASSYFPHRRRRRGGGFVCSVPP